MHTYIWHLAFIPGFYQTLHYTHQLPKLLLNWIDPWQNWQLAEYASQICEQQLYENGWRECEVPVVLWHFSVQFFFQSHLMLIKNAIWPIKWQVVCRQDILYIKCVYSICGLSFSQGKMLPTPVSWLSLDKLFCSGLLSHIFRSTMLCFLKEVRDSNVYCIFSFASIASLLDLQHIQSV